MFFDKSSKYLYILHEMNTARNGKFEEKDEFIKPNLACKRISTVHEADETWEVVEI